MDATLATRIKAISNVFETGAPEANYPYVENLGDGRGYTVTNYGFCTSTGEVAAVIARYSATVPATPLSRFLPSMPPLREDDDMKALRAFPAAWRKEAAVASSLRAACDAEADKLFFRPALTAAASAQIHSPIGTSIFYDTWLQHGGGTDPDSFAAIYSRTLGTTGGRDQCPEEVFLRAFLSARKAVLLAPADSHTRSAWRRSALRVDALLNLLDDNPNLVAPVQVTNAEISATIF
jgi:chitosanase